MKQSLVFVVAFLLSGFGLGPRAHADLSIEERLSEFQKFEFTDPRLDGLSSDDQKLIANLIAAGQVIDTLFLDQMDPRNVRTWVPTIRSNPDLKPYLDYFWISFGPWDVFNRSWILPPSDGLAPAPLLAGKGFYSPEINGTAQKTEDQKKYALGLLNKWITDHPKDKKPFFDAYTVIQEAPEGFRAIPYSDAYKPSMTAVAGYLRAAAKFAREKKVRKLLVTRAKAFLNNQFDETEKFWIDNHDSNVQITIGPYEQYQDEVLGVKGGFEVRVGLKDPSLSRELDEVMAMRDDLQKNVGTLTVPNMFLGDKRGTAHMTVMNEIFYGGLARFRVPAMAHKLPNSEPVIAKHGLRQVFFKNVFDGKCSVILQPLSKLVMAPQFAKDVSCDSFVKFTLHHENAHALGPAFVYPQPGGQGEKKEFEVALGPDASPLEEAKADVMGVFDRAYMLDHGKEAVEGKSADDLREEMYASFVAGIFRSIRWGVDAHSRGTLLQLNRLKEFGAIGFDSNGQVVLDPAKMADGVKDLLTYILTLQTNGDPKALGEALDHYGTASPEVEALLTKLKNAGIPRDLYPVFPVLKKAWVRDLG